MRKYKIGEVCRILELSRETIRYYERCGLVVPEKDEETGYRYYTSVQINQLMHMRQFRNMEFSSEEILEYISSTGFAPKAEVYRRKRRELLEEIRRKEKLVECIDAFLLEEPALRVLQGQLRREEVPGFYYIIDQTDQRIDQSGEMLRSAGAFRTHTPRTHAMAFYEAPETGLEIHWGFYCMEDTARELGLDRLPLVRYCPAGTWTVTAVEIPAGKRIRREDIAPLWRDLGLEGREAEGMAVGVSCITGEILGRLPQRLHKLMVKKA